MRFHTIPLLLFSLTAFAGPAIQFCADRPQKVAVESYGVAAWILQAEETYRAVPCGQPQTNFVGACWLSGHNPTNAVDHLLRVYEEVVQYFPNCPPTTNTVAVLGWTHNIAVLRQGEYIDESLCHALRF